MSTAAADRDQSPQPATAAEHDDLVHRDSDIPEDAAPPLPPFEPLFTLLTNATTNATVHPRVHYIFADDDPSVLAAAAATTADPSHRALVVDLAAAPAGDPGRWAVSWASSMSPSFAVTGSSVAVQQNEGDDAGEDDRRAGGGAALMLRVKGVEHEPVDMRPDSLPSSGSGTSLGREDVEGLAEDFRRRMGVLKKVVDEGEKRRAVLGHQQQQVEDEDAPEVAVVGDEDVKEKSKAGD
ncbi:hypothetical protein EDB81DRAFT_854353 [Dactylonectria macrodidyma]|uniref:Uncharacterized protein n=1 Tax=Dactylonectria macrodidyma TaxID=307937 RepID=A0A9P9F7L6_9HYPO|nr:hypothetical protein EDB81DRAFT_854353 [Dactylonectria macrodidyma]